MSIDLSQFHQIFFEESFEGLDVMEQQLVQLEPGSEDLESINTIFRAAHSIKGGSGTFGFQEVADFTHVVESLLDEMRTGERELTQEALDLLLITVDVLRAMLTALQEELPIDKEAVKACHDKLINFEKASSDGTAIGASASSESSQPESLDSESSSGGEQEQSQTWEIIFKPYSNILVTGNEPTRMFRELETLGQLKATVDLSKLPVFISLEPENLFLSWTLVLESDCDKEDIDEVFEWVLDDCDLSISLLSQEKKLTSEQPEVSASEANTSEKDKEVTEEEKFPVEKSLSSRETVSDKKIDATNTASSASKKVISTRSIRVDIAKVDELINRVGELVITQSMLAELGETITPESIEKLRTGLSGLEQNTRELQESVMSIRMLPISFAFNRFPRLVKDVSRQLEKEVELVIKGETTELDKTVMEQISDPLVHIVRNSLDHGFELPDERLENGKERCGTLTLDAYHKGGEIVIEIIDDGRGLNRDRILEKALSKGLISINDELTDEQVWQLIFEPGFSTAEAVSDLSGRGVGMDVVKRNIATLGGSVDMFSTEGKGTRIMIRLPLTLAILDGQLVRVGKEIFIVPLMAMVESLELDHKAIKTFGKKGEMYQLREQFIPLLNLQQELGMVSNNSNNEKLLLVVESDGLQHGFIIDDLLTQQQVVVKSLDANFKTIPGISGATILGNGRVALIVDVAGFVKRCRKIHENNDRMKTFT